MLTALLQILIVLLLLFLSTYGWGPSKKYNFTLSETESERAGRLKNIVRALSIDIGVRNFRYYYNLEESVEYINAAFRKLGYTVDNQAYEVEGLVFRNSIAYDSPEPNKPTLVIGAHYDSCYNPGADDNASGVAVLIELARLLKNENLNHNLKFIAFVNEEPPFFMTDKMGSAVYVSRAKKRGENIKAAIILEMLGFYSEKPFSQRYLPLLGPFYPNKGNFIAIVGNFPSRNLTSKMRKGLVENGHFPAEGVVAPSFIPGIYFSDHYNFWKQGYQAVMVTDTAFLRSPHYHSNSDLPNTLNYDKMAKITGALKEAILRLDKEL